MGLLDTVKEKIEKENDVAMEEYDIMSSMDDDEDILLEAALRGEDKILGDDNDDMDDEMLINDNEDDNDPSKVEDPDLGEDDDNLDFSFESNIPNDIQSIMNDYDEEEEIDPLFDDEDDVDTLFDTVIDEMGSEDDDDDMDDDDDF